MERDDPKVSRGFLHLYSLLHSLPFLQVMWEVLYLSGISLTVLTKRRTLHGCFPTPKLAITSGSHPYSLRSNSLLNHCAANW